MLQLDDHGEEVLRGWVNRSDTEISDVNLVEQVLVAFSHQDGRVPKMWFTSRPVDGSGDLVVHARERLLIRIRPFVPEDSALFTLVSIVED